MPLTVYTEDELMVGYEARLQVISISTTLLPASVPRSLVVTMDTLMAICMRDLLLFASKPGSYCLTNSMRL